MKGARGRQTGVIDPMTKKSEQRPGLLDAPLRVVNVGLEGFARDLESHGISVVDVDWAPPARGDVKLAHLLSKLGG